MALLRIPVGAIALVHLWPIATDAWDGRQYRDVFHEPYAAWYPELPRCPYAVLVTIAVVAAVAMTLGLLTILVGPSCAQQNSSPASFDVAPHAQQRFHGWRSIASTCSPCCATIS